MTSTADVAEGQAAARLLLDDARARLIKGQPPRSLFADLEKRGLPPKLAAYVIEHARREAAGMLRARAARTALSGFSWLLVGGLAIVATHQVSGAWPDHGPELTIWGVVLCGGLRLTGGLLQRFAFSPESGSSGREMGARVSPARVWEGGAERPSARDYQLLGLREGASPEAISSAYRTLAKLWHPDRFADSAEMRSRAAKRMAAVNAAHERLSRSV